MILQFKTIGDQINMDAEMHNGKVSYDEPDYSSVELDWFQRVWEKQQDASRRSYCCFVILNQNSDGPGEAIGCLTKR